MAEKNYISGLLIKEVGEYGNLNISVYVEDFIHDLKKIENKGWANIIIAKNRKPTDKGYTHHSYENTWKPKGSESSQKDTGFGKAKEIEAPEDNLDNALPF